MLLAAASLLVAGCSAGDAPRPRAAIGADDGTTTARPGTAARAPAAAPAAGRADPPRADGRLLLDMRQPDATSVVDVGLQARAQQLVYGDGAPGDVRLVAAHSGSFTAAGRRQHAVLLARGDGIGPAPAPPLLAVLDGDRVAAQFVPDPAYTAMPAAADVDGDGLDDLLLVVMGYQMGQSWESVDVVSLAAGRLVVVDSVTEARFDGCDNPAGERAVRAAVLVRDAEGLRADRYVADCVAGSAPDPDAFRPAPVTR